MDIEISKEPVEYLSDFPQHLCNMCGKCCKAITTPYSWEELVELAKQGQEEAKVFVEVFVRYDSVDEARAAVPDNKCAIHATRPDCCRRAPRNGWSLFPPGCGFKGWQFMQKEKVKASVRALKEYLLELELLPEDEVLPEKGKTVKQMKDFIKQKIKPWEKYGALYW